jgi:hypothetical protein
MKFSMKVNIIPTKRVAILSFCAVMLAFSYTASATPHPLPPVINLTMGPITGEIHFVGDAIFDSVNLSTATTLNTWISAQNTLQQSTVVSATGDFGTVPFGSLADMAHPWIFSPSTPTPGLWNLPAFGFSFDLTSVTSVVRNGNLGLEIFADGILHGTGFDDTPGQYSFSVTNPDGRPHIVFAFAAETIGVPTPDGGAAVALLGIALIGIEGLRRKLMAA